MKTALIVLGHGSRAAEAVETLAAVALMVREKGPFDRVEYASLQLSKPELGPVVEKLAGEGFKRLLVVPFMLAAGQHIKVDIPHKLAALSRRLPGVEMHLCRPLGADPRLADIMLERAAEMERSL